MTFYLHRISVAGTTLESTLRNFWRHVMGAAPLRVRIFGGAVRICVRGRIVGAVRQQRGRPADRGMLEPSVYRGLPVDFSSDA
jgi:hypothetical protein